MMQLAIISDIHGKAHAVREVLKDITDQGINERVCLGDVVGYGGSPGKCIDLLRKHVFQCVRGNHDDMVTSGQKLDTVTDAPHLSMAWTRSALNPDQTEWIANLPFTFKGSDCEAVHSSLHRHSDWPYVLMPDMAAQSFLHQVSPVCFIGHTHRPAFWVEGAALGMDTTCIEALRPGRKCLVNVGSVGQPRDRDGRACYAIYRLDAKDILWRRLAYDIIGAQQAIIDAGLPAYFAQRLQLGK
jgi:predicted phosphodiesterase